MLRLEFAHYDYRSQGSISAKDFALSMVASADMSHINKFLDRVEELNDEPRLRDVRISFDEFKNFAELRKKLQPFTLAIFSYGKSVNGLLSKDDFKRAAKHVCLQRFFLLPLSYFMLSLPLPNVVKQKWLQALSTLVPPHRDQE